MIEDRQQIIALDIAPDDAQATAERLRKQLRDRRFAVAHPDAVDPIPPNHEARGVAVPADLLGPGFVATPYGSELPGCNPLWSFIYTYVPTDPDNRICQLGDSTGPSDCRSSGTPFPEDRFWEAFNPWFEGPEPTVACGNCGKTAPMGDEDTSGSIVVSPLGIVMSGDGWDLVRELLGALRTDFGGRWRWVGYRPQRLPASARGRMKA